MLMVDKADDPIAMWQQMIGEMQKGFHAFSNQLSAVPASGDASDQTASPGSAQKQLADIMESYFAGLNLPSRAQLSSIADRLQAIESQLSDIKGLLHEALMNSRAVEADNGAAKSSPARPRPKRPGPAKSDK
jgi:hypothetical protein